MRWNIQFEFTAFHRNEKNRIDWIRETVEDPWRVTNIGKLKQSGLTLSIKNPIFHRFQFQFDYTYLSHKLSRLGTAQSKYLDFIPEHRGLLKGIYKWPKDTQFTVILDVRQHKQKKIVDLIDFKITVPLKDMHLYFEMINLLNTHYQEIPNCPMPGRRFRTGFQISK